MSVAADERCRAEAKIEPVLEWDEPTRALLYDLLHKLGMTVERADMVLRRAGWR